tara:strand:+ start:1507 stop:1821 length:315 start_codon:yes stop_codon:yes gene_type:complete
MDESTFWNSPFYLLLLPHTKKGRLLGLTYLFGDEGSERGALVATKVRRRAERRVRLRVCLEQHSGFGVRGRRALRRPHLSGRTAAVPHFEEIWFVKEERGKQAQ